MRLFAPFVAVLLLGATGCMVGPKYVKPTVQPFLAPSAPNFNAYKESDPNWHPASPGRRHPPRRLVEHLP